MILEKNNNFTNKTCKYLNPNFDQVDGLAKAAIDDCTKYFHNFNYKCVFVLEIFHQTHGTTSYFTLSNKVNFQHEEVEEAID